MAKDNFQALAEIHVVYNVKGRVFAALVETHHYEIDEHIVSQFKYKDVTLKEGVNKFSKICLDEYYLLVNSYKYKSFCIKINYSNNRIFNMFMDKNNMWMDQLKNLLKIDYSLVFRKEEKNG